MLMANVHLEIMERTQTVDFGEVCRKWSHLLEIEL